MAYQELRETKTVTIAQNGNLSAAIVLTGLVPIAIQMPAGWTAADLTFQSSADGTTYGDVYDGVGSEYVVAAASSRYILIDPVDALAFQFLKIRSGTTGTPVTQLSADKVMSMVVRPI